MPAPRKALVSKKTPVAMISHVLNALDAFWAMDASLRKEGKKALIGDGKEKECLQSAHLALLGIRIHARKIQKEEFNAACKKFEKRMRSIRRMVAVRRTRTRQLARKNEEVIMIKRGLTGSPSGIFGCLV